MNSHAVLVLLCVINTVFLLLLSLLRGFPLDYSKFRCGLRAGHIRWLHWLQW